MKTRVPCLLAFATTLFTWTASFGQIPGLTPPKHYPWSDKALSPDQRADMVIKEMTVDEKIQLLHGLGWQAMMTQPESGPATRAISTRGFIPGLPRLAIPDLQMTECVASVSA